MDRELVAGGNRTTVSVAWLGEDEAEALGYEGMIAVHRVEDNRLHMPNYAFGRETRLGIATSLMRDEWDDLRRAVLCIHHGMSSLTPLSRIDQEIIADAVSQAKILVDEIQGALSSTVHPVEGERADAMTEQLARMLQRQMRGEE